MPQLSVATLDKLGVLRIRGKDAATFLQGQISNDISRLIAAGSLLAGVHTPQGRTLALLRLFALHEDDLLAVLPASLLAATAGQLTRYVLRARVTIQDAGAEWRVYGLHGPDAEVAAQLRQRVALDDAASRFLVVAPRHEAPPQGHVMDTDDWRGFDIAAGLPQVYPATSGEFVAQMLNLDLLDGISFNKGCYTGQEVIARAHYRGKVKRRMQRFATEDTRMLTAGDTARLPDGRTLRIVDAAPLPEGGWDFLAVAPLLAAADPGAEAAAESGSPPLLAAESLPLPYVLPALD